MRASNFEVIHPTQDLARLAPRVGAEPRAGACSSLASLESALPSLERNLVKPRLAHPKKPALWPRSSSSGRLQALRAMRRMAREMEESSMASGVAAFWVRRAVA